MVASRRAIFGLVIAFAAGVLVGLSMRGDGSADRHDTAKRRGPAEREGTAQAVAPDSQPDRKRDRIDVTAARNSVQDDAPTPGDTSAGAPDAGAATAPTVSDAPAAASAAPTGAWTDARAGQVKFHFEQAVSLETGKVVDADAADLILTGTAGGLSSLTFRAPHGAITLHDLLGRIDRREQSDEDPRLLFHALGGIDPNRIGMPEVAEVDSRSPRSEVLLVRTRNGGFAKVLVAARAEGRDWQKREVTLQYVHNPSAPAFKDLGDGHDERVGLLFPSSTTLRNFAIAVTAPAPGHRAGEAVAEGCMPDPQRVQEVLHARSAFKDYEKATYSFEKRLRDDPEKITRNDWDLQFSGDLFRVRMVTDDTSTISDLGLATWDEIAARAVLAERTHSEVPARGSHVYLIRTRDTESAHTTLIRVTAFQPGRFAAIEWLTARRGEITASPEFSDPGGVRGALERILLETDGGGRAPLADDLSDRAAGVYVALAAHRGAFYVDYDWTLQRLLDRMSESGITTSIAPTLGGETLTTTLDAGGTGITLSDLLDMVTRQLGAAWTVDSNGVLRVEPVAVRR